MRCRYELFRAHLTRRLSVKARAAGFASDLTREQQLSRNMAAVWQQLPGNKQLQFAQLALELRQQLSSRRSAAAATSADVIAAAAGISVVVRLVKVVYLHVR